MTDEEKAILKHLNNHLGSASKNKLMEVAGIKKFREFQIVMNRLIDEQELVSESTIDFAYCITPKGRDLMYDFGE